MRVFKESLSDVLAFLNHLDPAAEPKPVHIKDITFDSTAGHYVITYLPSGLSYPALPSRTKAGVLDDAAPVALTTGTVLTEYNQCRLYIEVLDGAGAAIPAGSATVILWHRTRRGDEDAPAPPAVGTWLRGLTVAAINTDQEVIDTMLYHREVYVQLTNIAGGFPASVTIYIAGIEDSEFQQPLSFAPGGALEAHLTGVNIEGANLEVQIEATPDDPGEEADSVIVASTLDSTLPTDPGNLAPPVMPIKIDSRGRYIVEGTASVEALAPSVFPNVVAGHHSVSAIYAALTTALAGANNDLVFGAVEPGAPGNDITVEYADGGAGSSLTVGVAGKAIVFTGDIAAGVTPNQIMGLVADNAGIFSLVHAENAPGDDGTGNVIIMAPAALIGGAGVTRVKALPIGKEDTTCIDEGLILGGRGYFGNPAAIGADGRWVPMLFGPMGHTRVILDSKITEIGHSIKTRPIIPEEIVDGGVHTTSATPGNTLALTIASNPLKHGVWMRISPKFGINAMLGAFFTAGNGTIISAAGLPVAGFMWMRDDPGLLFIPIDDAAKIYVSCDSISAIISWIGI